MIPALVLAFVCGAAVRVATPHWPLRRSLAVGGALGFALGWFVALSGGA